MSLKIAILAMPLAIALVGCGDSKKTTEAAQPAAQPAAKESAPKADPPAKVDIHITNDHQEEPKEPEAAENGIGVQIQADLEIK